MAVLLICVSLSGCLDNQSSRDNRFVGTWEKSEYDILSFSFDGTCSYGGSMGTWEIKDETLVLDKFVTGLSIVYDFYFSDDETILYLKSQNDETFDAFIKQ